MHRPMLRGGSADVPNPTSFGGSSSSPSTESETKSRSLVSAAEFTQTLTVDNSVPRLLNSLSSLKLPEFPYSLSFLGFLARHAGVDGQKGLRLQLNSRQSSTVETGIPFNARRFEYSTEYSTYIPCRQTATWLADSRLHALGFLGSVGPLPICIFCVPPCPWPSVGFFSLHLFLFPLPPGS
eukprot:1121850-Prorocentrum_minimum.AAC.1